MIMVCTPDMEFFVSDHNGSLCTTDRSLRLGPARRGGPGPKLSLIRRQELAAGVFGLTGAGTRSPGERAGGQRAHYYEAFIQDSLSFSHHPRS